MKVHTALQLAESFFEVRIEGHAATRADLLPDWGPHDRLAVVVRTPYAAVGASHLIQLAITAFYDAVPSRRAAARSRDPQDPRSIYPEIFAIHVGGWRGDLSYLDVWPARKEVLVPDDPRKVLDTVNNLAITRLLVPDLPARELEHEWKEPAAAQERIVSAFLYDASGRTADADAEITGLKSRTEVNVRNLLDMDAVAAKIRDGRVSGRPGQAALAAFDDPDLEDRRWETRVLRRAGEAAGGLAKARADREAIRDADGLASESYRRITVAEALSRLAS
ncbi:MAG: hypothetical protein JST08_00565 [Actinobacteria bacterium]|nr:hypothetical protein [Actinomycetota bacterium]